MSTFESADALLRFVEMSGGRVLNGPTVVSDTDNPSPLLSDAELRQHGIPVNDPTRLVQVEVLGPTDDWQARQAEFFADELASRQRERDAMAAQGWDGKRPVTGIFTMDIS